MINALRYTEELEKAGFTPDQAKVSVETWMSLIDQNFATKDDLKSEIRDLRHELKSEIKDLRHELKTDINRTVIQMGILMTSISGMGFTILGFLVTR